MRWIALSCLALAGFSAAHGQVNGDDKPVAMQAGQWESTIAYTNVDFDGLPGDQARGLRELMSPPRIESRCMTPEQVANPLGGLASQPNCEATRSVFAGGAIDVAAICVQNHDKARMTLTGTYTADRYRALLQVETRTPQVGDSGPRTFRTAMSFQGRRTGPCTEPATAPKPAGGEAG